jgi:hypothetical protein
MLVRAGPWDDRPVEEQEDAQVREPVARVRFGPDATSWAGVLILAAGAVPLALTDRRLLLVLVVPLAWAVWVLRARVVVTREGLEVCNGLRVHRLAWPELEGYRLPPRGPAQALGPAGPVALRALPRPRLRALVEASERVSGSAA